MADTPYTAAEHFFVTGEELEPLDSWVGEYCPTRCRHLRHLRWQELLGEYTVERCLCDLYEQALRYGRGPGLQQGHLRCRECTEDVRGEKDDQA